MRTFRVVRHVDVTGLSGTGTVSEGGEFSDGSVVMRWFDIDHDSRTLKLVDVPDEVVAEGCEFSDGRVVLVWCDDSRFYNYKNVEEVEARDGLTEVVFD